LGRVVAAVRRQADTVYSMGVYAVVVFTAASSQTQVFAQWWGWAWPRAVAAAVFLEGTALVFALTGHRLRLLGEHALLCRALTWISALFGASINYVAHAHDPGLPGWAAQLQGLAVGASSLVGIIIWEIRSSAASRATARAALKKAPPKPRLGLDFWVRYPRLAFWAWSAMVADPRVRTRAKAIKQGKKLYARHRAQQAADQAARQAGRDRKAFMTAARKAAKKAAKTGEPGPALMYLGLLAQHGPTLMAQRPAVGPAPVAAPPPGGGDSASVTGPQACGCADATRASAEVAQAVTVLTQSWTDLTASWASLGPWPTPGPIPGVPDWAERLDELDDAFRTDDGTELPLPGRKAVIAHMSARPGPLRFTWTSHTVIDQAIRDLRARRNARTGPTT
jgi:hypothetical protein